MKFKINLHKIANFAASLSAVFTMVMSPVAMGREAQKITVNQLKTAMSEAGLNKQITVGEFYAKNKHLVPPRLEKEFESFVSAYKNQMMPRFEVVGAKATDGTEVATLRLTQGDEVLTIQMLGEPEKFAKIQNTYVTEIDVINFNDMFTRVLAGDEKYRKQYESAISPATPKAAFTGFPDLTVAAWKKMSQKERAGYIVNMRLLWNDARRVLIEAERKDKKGRKTSSLDNSVIEKWDAFLALISPAAEAQPMRLKSPSAQKPGGVSSMVKQGRSSSAYVSGSNCLVAGYVSRYSATKCGIDGIYESYRDANGTDDLVQSVNQICSSKGANQIACNPYVYGTPGGNPICVDTTISNFQVATHYDGPCDSQSRLGSNVPFLKDENLKNSKRYDPENMVLSEEELKAKYLEEQKANPKMVEDYLNGLLAYKKTTGVDFSKPLNDEVLGSLLKIKENFDNDIQKARDSCKEATKNKGNEPNFWGACDQLRRRFLNVAQFLQKSPGCPGGGTVSESSLKCMCPSGPEVLPGTACGSQQPPPSCPIVAPAPPAASPVTPPPAPPSQDCVPGGSPGAGDPNKPGENCEEKYPGAVGLDASCKCAGGAEPSLAADAADGTIKHYSCSGKDKDKEKECGFLCKTGKFFKKNWLLIGGGIIGTFIAYKLLKKFFDVKKPKLKSPGDTCPNGANAPCPQTCAAPLALLATGLCGCAECPPGQTISNASTCSCSSTSSTTELTCPDGVTKVTDLANCPATNYTCWDGSTVTNPLNCPEQPSSNSPSKSGTGKVKK